jgi:putative tricarboxylic transport membrane protein
VKNKDRLISIVILIVCAFFFYLTLDMPVPEEGLGPTFFPRLLLGLVAALAFLQLIISFLKKDPEEVKEVDEGQKKRGKWVWMVFAFFGVFIFLLDFLGFILSAILFITVTYLLISPSQAWKSNVKTLAILFVIVIGLRFFFQDLLGVRLPSGIF